ncbi:MULTISPECIES: ATP-grasp domain-containing protein [Thermomonosporaceae]|uniref:carboxylate--amine ligase n=1 Tax=Thermomonosporaceae TaxID=2012 RepID=UPI00255ABD26|nr:MULTISPECIES: ATP-grasp domain-containing protein [Thermomonosporaceae]MDL4773210.1 ATP-grasp domain-containing protein [Actinomadura xylanilytica]
MPHDTRDERAAPGTLTPELDPHLPVLLLRTDHNPLHHGTLAAIRSLGRAGVPVHAMLEGRTTPAASSRYLLHRHPWGPPPHERAELQEHLRGVAARIGRPALLVPMDDAGAIFVAESADTLADWFVFPWQEPALPRRAADKSMLLAECRRQGIACPESRIPGSAAEVDAAVSGLGLPLIAKWARPWRLPPGRRSTMVIGDAAEVHRLFAESGGAAGPLILQRRIESERCDWFFQGYFDQELTCLYGGTGRKYLSYPAQAGHTVLGEWTFTPELEQLARKVVRMLGVRGVVDLDFGFDADTGTFHLLDFNPRLGAQFRLFTDGQGLDLVRVAHLEQSGRPVPPIQPGYGRSLLVENHYVQRALRRPALRRAPRPTTRPEPRPAGGPAGPPPDGPAQRAGRRRRWSPRAAELTWYAADDLAPCLAIGRQLLLRVAGTLRRGPMRPHRDAPHRDTPHRDARLATGRRFRRQARGS